MAKTKTYTAQLRAKLKTGDVLSYYQNMTSFMLE